MGATHVVTEFVGEGVVARGVGAADDAKRIAGEVGRDRRHQVAQPGIGGLHGLREQAHHVCPVLIANAVNRIHLTVAGALQPGQVRGSIAGLRVGHLATIDEIQGHRDQAVYIGIVRLGNRQIDQRVHRRNAASAGLGRCGVNHHDIHVGVRARVGFNRRL